MIGVIYLGTNTETQERLKYIPGRCQTEAPRCYREEENRGYSDGNV